MKNSQSFPILTALLLAALALSSQAGSIVRFFYEGDSSASNPTAFRQSVSTLKAFGRFPNSPTYREQLDDFFNISGQPLNAGLQGKDNSGADYGSWVRGYLEAPATGNYRFGLASADNSELWLGTNHLAEGKALVAFEPGGGEPLFTGNRLETRVSAPIHLEKAKKYYFEVFHQHGGGAGYIQVGWQRPDGTQEIIPALHLSQYEDESAMDNYGGYFNLAGSAPVFNNPANTGNLRGGYLGGDITNVVAIAEGAELLLPLDVIAPQPTTFQWTSNGVVLPDQNLSYFRIPRTPASYNGVKLQAIVSNEFGSLRSKVATVTVTADTVRPTVLTVDTAGNPNLIQVVFSEPVKPQTATNTANYIVKDAANAPLSVATATLQPDGFTVLLAGTFNFQSGPNYTLEIRDVTDNASTANVVSPNPTVATFTLTAPLGTTYTFEAGQPSNLRLFGNAAIRTVDAGSSGTGVLSLTDSTRAQNGHALLTDRRDIDQAHIKFNVRASDAGASVFTDLPWGDGFSLNISSGLPLGTFSSPQFGYSPSVPGSQLTIFFNAHENSVDQPASIGVSLNSQIVTNILAGTNGIPLNGVPSITSTDGHWAAVDINIKRDGTLDLSFDGVTLLSGFQTDWVGIRSAQIGLAASTRGWFETHWIDDLYVNFGEGDVGNVGLGAGSVLGGSFAENSLVRLIAAPTGAGPFTYQWYKNDSPVAGATNRILAFTGASGSGAPSTSRSATPSAVL